MDGPWTVPRLAPNSTDPRLNRPRTDGPRNPQRRPEEDDVITYEDYKQYLSPALSKATNLVIDHGEGSYVWDVSGRRYLRAW